MRTIVEISWKDLQFHNKLHLGQELEEFPETWENVEAARHFDFRVTTSGYSHVSHRDTPVITIKSQWMNSFATVGRARNGCRAISTVSRQPKNRNGNLGQFPTLLGTLFGENFRELTTRTISLTTVTRITGTQLILTINWILIYFSALNKKHTLLWIRLRHSSVFVYFVFEIAMESWSFRDEFVLMVKGKGKIIQKCTNKLKRKISLIFKIYGSQLLMIKYQKISFDLKGKILW